METVACNLCGSTETIQRFTLPDFLLGRPEVRTTLVQCAQCGLVYQNPRPTLEEMAAHYPPEYEPFTNPLDDHNASWLLRQAVRYGFSKRCRFVTRHKAEGRLLDVGCATGLFLRAMQTHGRWDLYGVEPNDLAARTARERYHLNVFTGTLEEAAFPDGFFDVVTLWDVLEHLHDPAGSLREIHRILKPDGILLVRVPNLASWDARLFGRYWAGLDAPRHLYVFTPHTLAALFRRTGFQVIEQSTRSGGYPTFLLSLRFWLRGRGAQPTLSQIVLAVLHHPVARVLTAPAFFVAGQVRRGPLLVATAVKR